MKLIVKVIATTGVILNSTNTENAVNIISRRVTASALTDTFPR